MYTNIQQMIVLLNSLNFSNSKILKFYEYFKDEDDIIELIKEYPESLKMVFTDKEIKDIKTAILKEIHVKTIEKLNKMRIFCLFYDADEYPNNLISISDPPMVLYCLGDKSLLRSKKLVAIVGSRKPTRYGKDITEKFVKDLLNIGIIPVSDLAYGIDGIVAESAVNNHGKTVVLLAGGLDSIYPASHTELARKVVKNGGLLISEFLPNIKPIKPYFIERNRILAAISDGLLVVEASETSATFSTVNFALEYGRELFVIPGNITSETSKGTNKLISEIPHSFTISVQDIIDRFGLTEQIVNERTEQINMQLSPEERLIIDALKEGELNFDELQEKTKINIKNLATLLTRLEISGLIKKLPGNYYCI